uniref:ATP synthase F1 subunit 4 n=1 Tax=Dictyomenia sonderi TaxID=2007178 RepID=UPI0022FDA953|nr:ATP synthase F1 subunit 4 [Dictyomenia sonderi]WAX04253.1 ATP synthase F1 subunit 4 [Dictyomenia sonderi]
MKLFGFIILFVLIITNKLFLFNEEFLILISFISFCFVISEQLGNFVKNHFEAKTDKIKNSLLISLNLIKNVLIESKKINQKIILLQNNFTSLKKYYIKFSTDFFAQLILFLNNKEKANFLNKLYYLNKIEKDYLKLIVLLLLKKINVLDLLIKFYGNKLKIKRFRTLNLINKLNLIKKI